MKRRERVWRLREARRVEAEHKRQTGGKGEFARVTLFAAPAPTFSFHSSVVWPEGDDYDDWVLAAALDVLLCSGPDNPTGVELRLESIGWHDVDSCAVAFYWAARTAVGEIAGFDRYGYPAAFDPFPT